MGSGPAKPRIEIGNGNHGHHWHSVGVDGESLSKVIAETVSNGKTTVVKWRGYNLESQEYEDNTLVCSLKPFGALSAAVLTVNGSIWSSYPLPGNFKVHHFESLTAIIRWHNQVEGQWRLKMYGAAINAFDPFFFKHRGECLSSSVSMRMAGLAYKVRKVPEEQVKKPIPVDKRMPDPRDPAAFFPLRKPNSAPDDWNFIMPVSEVKQVTIFDRPGYRLTGAVFYGPQGQTFDLPVFVQNRNVSGGKPQPGDTFEGSLWLNGTFK